MTDDLLRLEDVSYSYPQSSWKLDRVQFSMNKGEFLALIGSNGSGKSTLLKIAAGITAPASGAVRLRSANLQKIARKSLAQSIGYLPQNISPTFDFSVEDVVAMGRFCRSGYFGALTSKDREIVDQCMEATEIRAFRGRKINQLSGGERQRVLLASVLAQQPEILLLDEPTTGLDIHHQASFFSLLESFARQQMAVLVITHDLNLASQFCGRVMLMDRGRIQVSGTANEVFARIQEMGEFAENLSFFEHPMNQKPSILPCHWRDVGDAGDAGRRQA
ncbi:MAG: hypothetical protein CSA62_10930 [Planctomycetota bacterium]|nr:MAG: hypothetical protein CSA62_10930 [Planctomycetota bacterium]